MRLVARLEKEMRVFISSECSLPPELCDYRANIPPEKLHDLLAFARLYVGEGATTAAECVMLGTPAIYINSLTAGTLQEHEANGLLFSLRDDRNLCACLDRVLSGNSFVSGLRSRVYRHIRQKKIDVTAFLAWFIEDYPESVRIMQERPDYQYRFR